MELVLCLSMELVLKLKLACIFQLKVSPHFSSSNFKLFKPLKWLILKTNVLKLI